jgi:hypothetical protein
MSFLNTIIPNCQQAARFQSEAMDKKLSFVKRVGLRLHLLICDLCRRYGKQIRFLHGAAHEHGDKFVGAGAQKLSSEAKERMKERLKNL